MRRTLSALLATGSLLVGFPAASLAQTNPGFSFNWGGNLPLRQQLGYRLDSGVPNARDRWKLKVRAQKIAVSKLYISYPEYYKGTFDPESIEFLVEDDKVPLSEVRADPEARLIELTPEEAVPADKPMAVVLSNVKNPANGGMYFFNARIDSPGDIPISRYIGTWVISIYRS